jgi:hypothetical protein
MKLVAALARSLQADMQAELRDLERAVAGGTSRQPPQVAEEGGVSVNLLAKILATLPRKPHGGVNLGPRESRW